MPARRRVAAALHLLDVSGVDSTPVRPDSEFYRIPADGAGDRDRPAEIPTTVLPRPMSPIAVPLRILVLRCSASPPGWIIRRLAAIPARSRSSRWRHIRCGSSSLPARAGCPGRRWLVLRGALRPAGVAGLGRGRPAAGPGAGRQGRRRRQGRRTPKDEPAPAADAAAAARPTAMPARQRRRGDGPPEAAREPAEPGDPGLGADRRLPAAALDLLHGAGDPAVHGAPRQRGRARAAGRAARGRDPRQEVPGRLRRLQGQRLVPGPAGARRHRQPAQRPAGGEGDRCSRPPTRSPPAWR